MIQPIRNNILVKAFKDNETTLSGLIVPDSYRKEGCKVEIVAVGNGTKSRPMKLKPNTIGFRVQEWGVPVEDNGTLFYLMDESAIIALN